MAAILWIFRGVWRMKLVAFAVEYDGTEFHGFQLQPGVRTVQGVLENAISKVENRPIRIVAASRTDAGVHARHQVIAFRSNRTFSAHKWLAAMRGLLPEDVRVWGVAFPPDSFHPQFTPHTKTYRYYISLCPVSVFERRYFWWVKGVDVGVLRAELLSASGTHNFLNFSKVGAPRVNTIRTLDVDVVVSGSRVILIFRSSGFLYGMVRFIVGTAVDVALGKLPPGAIKRVLEGDVRYRGRLAPPQGLFLEDIRYNTLSITWEKECDGI